MNAQEKRDQIKDEVFGILGGNKAQTDRLVTLINHLIELKMMERFGAPDEAIEAKIRDELT